MHFYLYLNTTNGVFYCLFLNKSNAVRKHKNQKYIRNKFISPAHDFFKSQYKNY